MRKRGDAFACHDILRRGGWGLYRQRALPAAPGLLFRGKVPYPLFFASLADEYPAVLFAHDIPIQTLQDHLPGIFGMDHAVSALIQLYVAHCPVVVGIFGQLLNFPLFRIAERCLARCPWRRFCPCRPQFPACIG